MNWITLKTEKFNEKTFQRIRNQVSDPRNSLPIFSQILKKYENICDTIAYDDINASIVWDCDDKNNKRKIIYPGGYKKFIRKIKKCKKNFIIIPLVFHKNYTCERSRVFLKLRETRLKMLISVNQKRYNIKKKTMKLYKAMDKMSTDENKHKLEQYLLKAKEEIKLLSSILINITNDFLNVLGEKSEDTNIKFSVQFYRDVFKKYHGFLIQTEMRYEKLADFLFNESKELDVLNWNNFEKDTKTMISLIKPSLEDADGHFNIIIYNKHKNTIFRFDPNGYIPESDFWYNHKKFDNEFKEKIKNNIKGVTFINSTNKNYCLNIGIQQKSGGDICVAWGFFMLEHTLLNPELNLIDIQRQIFDLDKNNLQNKIYNYYLLLKKEIYNYESAKKIDWHTRNKHSYAAMLEKPEKINWVTRNKDNHAMMLEKLKHFRVGGAKKCSQKRVGGAKKCSQKRVGGAKKCSQKRVGGAKKCSKILKSGNRKGQKCNRLNCKYHK